MAFLVLVVIASVRFGCKDAPPVSPASPAQPPLDAAIADALTDATPAARDAALVPPQRAQKPRPRTKRTPTPARPAPAQMPVTPVTPTPVTPTPVTPTPDRPQCTQPPNPAGCPATQPNVNRPCDAEGVHCVYGTSCCPPVYVCNNGAFEAWFKSCP